MNNQITAIILAKNEELMIKNCLDTLNWVDKIIVIDNGSTDSTSELAKKHKAKVIHFKHKSFAKLRNKALQYVETPWMIYIDPDERVTPTLAKEIQVNLETDTASVLKLKRKNYCYGHEFNHGGWDQDYVTRIFKKDSLNQWQGKIHESPQFKGKTELLKTPLIHLTHRSTTDNLKKTNQWTKQEAKLIYEHRNKKVTFLTILRKFIAEFIRRAVLKKGYQDGQAGLIEALVQGMNKALIYIQVWEMQLEPSLEQRYKKIERKISYLWKKAE